MVKVNVKDVGGFIVKNDERYVVKDNTHLKNLVLSSTDLNPGRQTSGHNHKGQEEVYIFTGGNGRMLLGDYGLIPGDPEVLTINKNFRVDEGDIVLIEDGKFHQVINDSEGMLSFVCVFDGGRNH